MRIAVFDDCDKDRFLLIQTIHNWFSQESHALATVHEYSRVNSLLNEVLLGHYYDLYFLDIMTDQALDAGFKLAEKIRQLDIQSLIVFTTNSANYMSSAFEISAFRYLTKPISSQKVHSILDAVKQSLILTKSTVGTFQGIEKKLIIPYSSITYIESLSFHHKARVFLITGGYKDISLASISFTEFAKSQLPAEFFQCHRGYIINLSHITGYKNDSVTLCDSLTLPISRERRSDFANAIFTYHKGII